MNEAATKSNGIEINGAFYIKPAVVNRIIHPHTCGHSRTRVSFTHWYFFLWENDANDDKCAAQKFKTSSEKENNNHQKIEREKWDKESSVKQIWVCQAITDLWTVRVFAFCAVCICVRIEWMNALTFPLYNNSSGSNIVSHIKNEP